MSGLRVGGYKGNAGEVPLIDLSPEVEVVEIDETTEEVVETPENEEQEESSEGVFVDFDENDPYEYIEEEGAKVIPEAPETEEPEGVSQEEDEEEEEEVQNVVEISEELLLKSLSEKLGREVLSFDELTEAKEVQVDPYIKSLTEWRDKTNRPIEDWVKFNRDFSKLSDIEVAREFLQIEYPELTQEEIELELETKFIASEYEDTDREVSLKGLELKKYASRGRKELEKVKVQFGEPNLDSFTPEVKESLKLADNYRKAVAKNAEEDREYLKAITSEASKIQSIKMELAEGVEVEYKLPQNSQKSLVSMVQEVPHWKNSDGSWNHEAVVKDAAILSNLGEMLKVAYEQGKNSGTDEVIREAKNTTLGNRTTHNSVAPQGGSGVQIEGLDRYLGKTGMSIRKRN